MRLQVAEGLKDPLETDAVPGLYAPDPRPPFVGAHRPAIAELDPVMDGNAPPEDLQVEGICPERLRIPDHDTVDRSGRYTMPAEDLRPEDGKVGAVTRSVGEGRVEADGEEAGGAVDTGTPLMFYQCKERI